MENPTVFLKNIDKKSPDKERFIQSALHESIHMLQEQSSDRESIENFLNQYFSKTKDKKLCQMTRVALFDSFREAETELHNIREELYSNKANLRTIEFDPDNYDTINFLLSRREEDALSKRISKKIDKAVKENPQIVKHFGKKMIYEFFLLSAISELEAYERSDYSVRKINNAGRSPYQRTIIALYKALQTICETRIKYDGNLFK